MYILVYTFPKPAHVILTPKSYSESATYHLCRKAIAIGELWQPWASTQLPSTTKNCNACFKSMEWQPILNSQLKIWPPWTLHEQCCQLLRTFLINEPTISLTIPKKLWMWWTWQRWSWWHLYGCSIWSSSSASSLHGVYMDNPSLCLNREQRPIGRVEWLGWMILRVVMSKFRFGKWQGPGESYRAIATFLPSSSSGMSVRRGHYVEHTSIPLTDYCSDSIQNHVSKFRFTGAFSTVLFDLNLTAA